MQVENILQSKGVVVHTVAAGAPIAEAVRMLNTHRIGAVVILEDGGHVAGILSERDIVRNMGDDPAGFLASPVADFMTRSVVTCSRGDSISNVMQTMTEFRIRHIPIVEDGALVGIVSIGDVVKRQIEEAEQEAEALKQYIAS